MQSRSAGGIYFISFLLGTKPLPYLGPFEVNISSKVRVIILLSLRTLKDLYRRLVVRNKKSLSDYPQQKMSRCQQSLGRFIEVCFSFVSILIKSTVSQPHFGITKRIFIRQGGEHWRIKCWSFCRISPINWGFTNVRKRQLIWSSHYGVIFKILAREVKFRGAHSLGFADTLSWGQRDIASLTRFVNDPAHK